jgi:hypothetical protein
MKLEGKARKAALALAKRAFPEWKGRKISAEFAASYPMEDYWEGGSRSYVKAINLVTGACTSPSPAARNPFNALAHARVEIPLGVILVEHSIFCGKDSGIRIYFPAPKALEPGVSRELGSDDFLAAVSANYLVAL